LGLGAALIHSFLPGLDPGIHLLARIVWTLGSSPREKVGVVGFCVALAMTRSVSGKAGNAPATKRVTRLKAYARV